MQGYGKASLADFIAVFFLSYFSLVFVMDHKEAVAFQTPRLASSLSESP